MARGPHASGDTLAQLGREPRPPLSPAGSDLTPSPTREPKELAPNMEG